MALERGAAANSVSLDGSLGRLSLLPGVREKQAYFERDAVARRLASVGWAQRNDASAATTREPDMYTDELAYALETAERTREIEFFGRGLAVVPPTILRAVHICDLDLSNNALATLPDAFADLAALTALNISRNRFATLPLVLGSLPELRALFATHNLLAGFDEVVACKRLEVLHLAANRIEDCPVGLWSLRALRELVLSAQRRPFELPGRALIAGPDDIVLAPDDPAEDTWERTLAFLPSDLAELTSLEVLAVEDNGLSELPLALAQLPGLTQVRFERNPIGSLPPALCALSCFSSLLVLSQCALVSLPDEFGLGTFTSLVKLCLDRNRLSALPASMSALVALETLDLSANMFSGFPQSIVRLPRLARLNMSANPLGSGDLLALDIGLASALRTLALKGCGLAELPRGLFRLTGLESLDLSSNPIAAIPTKIQCFRSLQTLRLCDCDGLRVLPQQLEHLPALVRLALNGSLNIVDPPYHVVAKGGDAVLLYLRTVGLGERKGGLKGPRAHRDWNTIHHKGRWRERRHNAERLDAMLALQPDELLAVFGDAYTRAQDDAAAAAAAAAAATSGAAAAKAAASVAPRKWFR